MLTTLEIYQILKRVTYLNRSVWEASTQSTTRSLVQHIPLSHQKAPKSNRVSKSEIRLILSDVSESITLPDMDTVQYLERMIRQGSLVHASIIYALEHCGVAPSSIDEQLVSDRIRFLYFTLLG